jgi:hypothetical protein
MSEDNPNIKKFTVTGEAARALGGPQAGGKRASRKRRADQAGGTSPGTLVQLNATRAPGSDVAPEVKPIETTGLKPSAAPVLGGGSTTKHMKVILAPKKKSAKVLVAGGGNKKLAQKVANAVSTAATTALSKTRKVAKKIRMSVSSLSKRMTRATKIRKDSKSLPIDDIKKTLKLNSLIKETTKAPEAILRQMYSDFLLLKKKAL